MHSFDYDPQSVACTAELRRRYFPDDTDCAVEEGSVLDREYLKRLGQFDVVYYWGVLHHTGAMWQALEHVAPLVARGRLFTAIYNDQGWLSRYWTYIKRFYNSGMVGKLVMIVMHWPYLFGLRLAVRLLRGRMQLERGMSLWVDMLDWLGGYPFEVAKPEEIFHFYRRKGFQLQTLKTCGGRHGCNEFVFVRSDYKSSGVMC